jgi:hypothetical protein
MKALCLVSVGALLLIGAAPASAALFRFEGVLFYTGIRGTCPEGEGVGERGQSRFTINTAGDKFSQISLLQNTFAIAYHSTAARFTRTYQPVRLTTIGSGAGTDDAGLARVRVTTQEPATIDSTTTHVYLEGQIEAPDGDDGGDGPGGQECVADFSASYVVKP